jgi:hypothetical protein
MKTQMIRNSLVLLLLLATSVTALFAQEETETPIPSAEETVTPVPPPAFTDGRISNTAGLGGLALYCVDENNINVSSIDDGSITVWGVGDQKYIELTADELRGDEEILQEPSVAETEGELTEAAPMMTETPAIASEEGADMPEATAVVLDEEPVLLARATTPNGEIGFFRISDDDQFALQGYDDKGAFFTYTWTGCNTGTVDHATAPFQPFLEAPIMEATEEMLTSDMDMVTPEATEGS